jgi:hypothetical protein
MTPNLLYQILRSETPLWTTLKSMSRAGTVSQSCVSTGGSRKNADYQT